MVHVIPDLCCAGVRHLVFGGDMEVMRAAFFVEKKWGWPLFQTFNTYDELIEATICDSLAHEDLHMICAELEGYFAGGGVDTIDNIHRSVVDGEI